MSNPRDITHRYNLADSIDLLSTLETMSVQYLDIDDQRVFVIYAGAILNLERDTGSLTGLSSVKITVYDLPLHSNRTEESEDEAATGLITKFITRLGTTADTNYKRAELSE